MKGAVVPLVLLGSCCLAAVPERASDAGARPADTGRCEAPRCPGVDGGVDGGLDAGFDGNPDAGVEGGPDAGLDAGRDAGCPATWTCNALVCSSVLAGDGDAGDVDGPGCVAELQYPSQLAVDSQGNLFVAEGGDVNGADGRLNGRVREISPDGTTLTVAGNGIVGFADGTAGPTGSAEFAGPSGVAVDAAGDVYVSDCRNNRVRVVSGGVVRTLAGSGTPGYADGPAGSAEFLCPEGVAVDAQGNVYVADSSSERIRKIAPDGTTTTLAGNGNAGLVDGTGGPQGTAEFHSPTSLAVDAAGNLFVADLANGCLREIAPDGTVKTLTAPGALQGPEGVAVGAGGALYVADWQAQSVDEVEPDGGILILVNQLSYPQGVAVDGSGNVYIADTGRHRILIARPR